MLVAVGDAPKLSGTHVLQAGMLPSRYYSYRILLFYDLEFCRCDF